MASKYVKDLEASVAKKHVGKKYNDRYQKALDKNPYTGPGGKSPGRMINARAAAKMGKRPSGMLYERAAKNEAAAKLIMNSFNDIKPYGRGETGQAGYTGGLRAKSANKMLNKSSRQYQTANVLKRKGF